MRLFRFLGLNLRKRDRFMCIITGDFYTLFFERKTGGLYQIVAQTKTRMNTGILRCFYAGNG